MENKDQKIIPEQPFRHRLDSHTWRKFILLFLIAFALSFDLLFLNLGKQLSKETIETKIQNNPTPLWANNIHTLTDGYPIEKMIPYIARRNKMTAAFLVSVAKQESNWGVHVPVLDGKDCYNYWGFRLASSKMTQDGYTCFDSPRQAVTVVSNRFDDLINNAGLDSPKDMVVWKCGFSCSGFDPQGVSDWINNVDYYFKKFY
jgi:hypothetical protein